MLRFGIFEGSKKPVATSGKVTVYSSRSEKDYDLIHSEEIAFTEAEAGSGAVTKYSVASWRTWAGLTQGSRSVEFWVGMVVEAGGKRVGVVRDTPPS